MGSIGNGWTAQWTEVNKPRLLSGNPSSLEAHECSFLARHVVGQIFDWTLSTRFHLSLWLDTSWAALSPRRNSLQTMTCCMRNATNLSPELRSPAWFFLWSHALANQSLRLGILQTNVSMCKRNVIRNHQKNTYCWHHLGWGWVDLTVIHRCLNCKYCFHICKQRLSCAGFVVQRKHSHHPSQHLDCLRSLRR